MICVDASVPAKWILEEDDSDKADALYTAILEVHEPIAAPSTITKTSLNIIRLFAH